MELTRYWSAGAGKGWPVDEVVAVLHERFDFGKRPGYLWVWGTPFMVNSAGPAPFIVTCDPNKATIALLCGEEVAFLPDLMPPPKPPPVGYAEQCAGAGDPWLLAVD
jgi:hypothetical protein